MTTLIIGAGALGCLFGGLLAQNGVPVVLYDTDRQKIERINRCGLTISELTDEKANENTIKRKLPLVAVSDLGAVGEVRRIVFAVKTFALAAAAESALPLNNPQVTAISLQNGLGNVETLQKFWQLPQILIGVTYQGAMEQEAGHILHTGSGNTLFAPLDAAYLSAAQASADFFTAHGLPSSAVGDYREPVWQKLMVNSVINPVSAVYGLPNGALTEGNPAADMRALLQENATVACAEGFSFDADQLWARALETCRRTAQNHSSMLRDVETGRCTEIDELNGALIRLGARHGLPMPVNKDFWRRVQALTKY